MRVFVDTGALLALNLTRDQHHRQAVALARRQHTSGSRYVSTTLVLSEKTVERHLSHIFAKLQVSSRSGATRLAVQAGIA